MLTTYGQGRWRLLLMTVAVLGAISAILVIPSTVVQFYNDTSSALAPYAGIKPPWWILRWGVAGGFVGLFLVSVGIPRRRGLPKFIHGEPRETFAYDSRSGGLIEYGTNETDLKSIQTAGLAPFTDKPGTGPPVEDVRASIRYSKPDGSLICNVNYGSWLGAHVNHASFRGGDTRDLVLYAADKNNFFALDDTRDAPGAAGVTPRPLPTAEEQITVQVSLFARDAGSSVTIGKYTYWIETNPLQVVAEKTKRTKPREGEAERKSEDPKPA